MAADFTDANGNSTDVAISGDGRVIAYSSDASNLIDGDDNLVSDAFATRNPLFQK